MSDNDNSPQPEPAPNPAPEPAADTSWVTFEEIRKSEDPRDIEHK